MRAVPRSLRDLLGVREGVQGQPGLVLLQRGWPLAPGWVGGFWGDAAILVGISAATPASLGQPELLETPSGCLPTSPTKAPRWGGRVGPLWGATCRQW